MKLQDATIIAIEDTPSICAFLRLSLESEGAEFHSASTAEDGVILCQKLRPDLIVLDLGLPDKDGLDILPELKELQQNGKPKVVVLTVRKDSHTIETAYARGANNYLTKPFVVEELLEVIEDEIEES